ncbi:TPA: hypothetical protein SOL98_001200 [Clostridioides difficile]|uniref:hypothetical protein n=1 Tax=Clostridioides difficile TaxID=1496 RepID=UPI0003B28C30|nr:hypothetical protein [Clostridioides difficile]EII6777318.1 hypothetical protein [Clostridioides difficile]EKJ1396044.1 hypothetical protein [Clostridioides difficile]MBG0325467.1 hypothetical protein [Clostridioides difficile]MBH8089494.1 hypothetical protein [Clostridioides difficile]MBH8160142.1 hypothetical protein [Clostridioides difficile]
MGEQMPIMKRLRNDKELLELRRLYKEKYNENAPGFNYDEYSSYDEYKEKLKELIQK